MEQHRSLLLFCCVLSLIAGGLIGYFTPHPSTRPIEVITPDPTVTPRPTATPLPLRVYVCGAVAQPGVYRLPPGSLVDDAIRAAGGPTNEADLIAINLALELKDQQQVTVPRVGETPPPEPVSGGVEPTPPAEPVPLNRATAAELEALPGIGPSLARRIIEYRDTYGPFETLEDLLNVPGVGPSILDELRDRVVID